LQIVALTIAGLAAVGAGSRPLVSSLSAGCRSELPAVPIPAVARDAGLGAVLALLGGGRTLAADLIWLRLHCAWEQRNRPAVEALLKMVTAMDPGSEYFWLNGARIVAHDFAAWRISAGGGLVDTPALAVETICRDQAWSALEFLEQALKFHPSSSELWIERAGLELNRTRDLGAAAESFRRAAELPGAPYFAARMHAMLLQRLGRRAEALAWLVRIHPALPRDEEAATAEVVLARIRALEEELGVAAEKCYQAAW
jgi:tetratricopeptide (TPR) repeat protein